MTIFISQVKKTHTVVHVFGINDLNKWVPCASNENFSQKSGAGIHNMFS
jgi:hypothetical protein